MSGSPRSDSASGFVRFDHDGSALHVREEWAEALVAAGLGDETQWLRAAGNAPGPVGRASTARLRAAGVPPLVLKELRRGGVAAHFRRRGFRGTGRLIANLRDPDALRSRGVATPRAAALLVVSRGAGRFAGYLAIEEVEGAEDLRRRWSRGAAGEEDLDAALFAVRAMHDAGFRHRDLNLGNLLLAGAPPRGFVIDLDGGTWSASPLPAGDRAAALRRLERSYAKTFPEPGPLGPPGRDLLWERYAREDAGRGREILRLRWTGKVAVAWHRLGWR